MRHRVLGTVERRLAMGAAVLLLGGFASGCSSDTSRFSDSLFTGSTYRGDTVVRPPANQPFPGDTMGSNRVDPTPTGTVSGQSNTGPVYGSTLSPVTGSSLPPVASSQPVRSAPGATMQPRRVASYEPPAAQTMSHPAKTTSHIADARPEHDASKPAHGPEHFAALPQQSRVKEGRTEASSAPAARAEASADVKSGKYTVQSGDSLYAIAKKTGASVADIKHANGLTTANVRIGQVLTIPGAAGGTKVAAAEPQKIDPVKTGTAAEAPKAGVAAPDEAKPDGYTPPRKADKQIAAVEDDDKAAAPDGTGIGKMRWPVRGRIISAFGSGGSEGDGIDISVPEGTPVKAAENGVVIYAGNGLKEFGNTVLVRHEDGLVTVYGHAKSLEVSRGDKVKRGQEIALSGMSGNADAPKLHFEVRKNSAPVDPRKYLE